MRLWTANMNYNHNLMSCTRFAIALLLIAAAQAIIPELNIAASTPVLNQELATNLGPKIVDILLNTTINSTFSESATYGIIKVEINISDIKFTNLDINWKNGTLVPKSDYTFRVNFKGISTGLTTHCEGHVSLKKINTTLQLDITGVNGYADFKLSAPTSLSGVGFNLQITYIEVEVDHIDITFKKDPIDTYVAQTVVTLLRKSIPHIVNNLVQNQINPMLENYCNSRAFITAQIGNHLYEINLNTTEVPKFINNSYMAIPLDIMVINVDTGKSNDEIDNEHLPLKPFNETDTVEITLSSGMVNTFLWLVEDSNLLDLYLDNSDLGDTAPINLNTSDLTILLPAMSQKYGKGHGVYIHITLSTKTPNLFIRGGRLLVSTAVNLEFIVDTKDALYPRNATECLAAGECISATTLNTSLVASAAFLINNKNKLFATIQTAKIVGAKPYEDSTIPVDEEGLKKILNTLIPSMILPLNQQLREGIDVPMGKIYGYNVTNVMLKTELDYLAAAVKFDFTPI